MTMSEHDNETGKFTIYARYGGAILMRGKADYIHYCEIEEAIRAAERLAFIHGQQVIADAITVTVRDQRHVVTESRGV